MYVIGTAGHVDHGKSALIRALTGIDPDRLQEEKDRGMTIDLGFAWLKLPGGEEVSIVDVPGHERFIKNMLAGVGGIDLALLVVAADEGVMPQTREHLAILDLLGVAQGVLVLTKSDLVESDWLDLVTADVEELASTTSLAGSPIVRCSVVTGDGLPELIEAISAKLAETTSKRDLGRPRLPIDRVFSIAGFGTVVTGTLIDGAFSVDQEVEILPAVVGGHLTSVRARIRGLQNHQSSVERSLPGTRTAANLAGVDRDQLRRGMVVTTPGWLQPSEAVDVRLRLLPGLTRTLRHNLNVSFHSYASEVPARVRLIEAKELLPGDEAWAQIRLLEPAALVNGDRFIIRDSNDTLGGGVIIETQARRHSRGESIATRLEARQSNNPAESLLAALPPTQPMEISALFARLDMSSEASVAALNQLVGEGSAVVLGQAEGRIVYAAPVFERLRQTALEAVQAYLSSHHLRRGIPREELRSRLNLPPRNFGLVIEALVARNDLVEVGAAVAAPDWRPTLSQSEQAAADAYLALLRATPLAPPLDKRPDEEIVAYLIDAGEVVEVGDSVVFDAAAYARMIAEITSFIREKGSATLAEVRDLLGTSRRYVAALLEHLDSRHITMRRGDERILRG